MLDLNSVMFYKSKFTISARDMSDDLLWEVVLEIRKWMTSKWNYRGNVVLSNNIRKWTALKNGGRIFSEEGENVVRIDSEYFNPFETDKQYWACRIVSDDVSVRAKELKVGDWPAYIKRKEPTNGDYSIVHRLCV